MFGFLGKEDGKTTAPGTVMMTNKEIRKAATESILAGRPKQETYEKFAGKSGLTAEKLANLIRAIPSLATRKQYANLNAILVIVLAISVIIKILSGISFVINKGIQWIWVPIFMPLIMIFLLWGIITCRGRSHRLVALLATFSLVRFLGAMHGVPFDAYLIIDLALLGPLIGLGFYLDAKLCPAYSIVKEQYRNAQGQPRLRNVIKFKE